MTYYGNLVRSTAYERKAPWWQVVFAGLFGKRRDLRDGVSR